MEQQGDIPKNSNKIDQKPGEGLRSLKTSNVFRTLNFELYTRPVSNNGIFSSILKISFIEHFMKYFLKYYNSIFIESSTKIKIMHF